MASVNAQGAQNFLYDALGRRESESGSIPTATFLYDEITPVRTTTGSANADLLSMPGTGEVFARTDSSGTMVPLHDQLGSTIGLVNGAGAITTQYAYGPFGTRSVTGAANANPFQFAGMENDSTGLYHTFARYYSPGLQRFLSEDPIGINGGDTNIFAYVHNDPIDMADPLGLSGGGGGSAGSGGPGGSGCDGCIPPPAPPRLYPGGKVGSPYPELPSFEQNMVETGSGVMMYSVNTLIETSEEIEDGLADTGQPFGVILEIGTDLAVSNENSGRGVAKAVMITASSYTVAEVLAGEGSSVGGPIPFLFTVGTIIALH